MEAAVKWLGFGRNDEYARVWRLIQRLCHSASIGIVYRVLFCRTVQRLESWGLRVQSELTRVVWAWALLFPTANS